jgi:hypothetical protein
MSDNLQEEETGTGSKIGRLIKPCLFCGKPVRRSERAKSFPKRVWIHKGCEADANRAMEEVMSEGEARGFFEAAGTTPQGKKIYKSLIYKSGSKMN